MKILYIHQYFKTPKEPGGTRSYWVAQELIKNGHQVTMITADPKATQKKREEIIDGIKVIYLQEAYSQDMSISTRLKAFLGFVWKSITEARKHKNIDLVIATSTPLTVGITALYMKWFKKVPYVFEVRDLWPEVPIQMGAFKSPFIVKPTRWFEKTIYKNAEHVIALSPGMRDGVTKYIYKTKTSMIPNMAKMDEFWPREKNCELEHKLGLNPNSFKIIHFGALGLANGAHTIIESAKLLKDDKSIEFLFVGGGSTEKNLVEECEKYQLNNVKFLGRFPMREMSEIVNLSDVSMVSFMDLPILYTNSPNKLFDSLSAGKPIIVNSAGWTKDMVEENNCGYYVNPNKPQELVDKILFLKEHPEVVIEMGQNSRTLAETVYDKSILCNRFVEIINLYNK
ncbi:glycosyltransferase family 4 protein [Flavobacterium dauae]|uniref:glycosyltransferase family 4 protein n=1 Tax=Flavobacterium dauae TaxID=1563479 RepID=UPI00101B281A|nr:glycosyltransferase family 4 protein [Flavobacterium dauae]WLD24702.1 glycosyltransferase family 4 protein [Flavobacterium dauae]